jgi:hypothetical protein
MMCWRTPGASCSRFYRTHKQSKFEVKSQDNCRMWPDNYIFTCLISN